MIPTDTIYGLVGSALSKKAVERVYKVRKRDKNKPFIVIIDSLNDLKKFGIKPSKEHLMILKALWDSVGAVSVILPLTGKQIIRKFSYLHRGKDSIAFRLPKDKLLRGILKKTGPLVAPSANIAGKKPARTIAEARYYFGDKIDFYLNGGKKKNYPSSVVEFKR